jgi:hypothetical protein
MAGSAMAMIVPSMKPSAEARIAAISRKRRSLTRQKPGAWPGFGVGVGVASGPPDRGRWPWTYQSSAGFAAGAAVTGRAMPGAAARPAPLEKVARRAALLAARKRVLGALHGAFEMGARLDRDGLVNDVALDPRGGGQAHLETAHAARDLAGDHHVVGHDLTLDIGAFADGQQVGADVALHRALDLDVAGGAQIAHDGQVGTQHRGAGFRLAGLGGRLVHGISGSAHVGRCARGASCVAIGAALLGPGFVDLGFRKHRVLP